MNPSKPRIVILLPLLDSIRNVVYSGLLENLLRRGVDVHLLFHNLDSSSRVNLPAGTQSQLLIAPPLRRRMKGLSFLKGVIGSAFSQRNAIGSYVLYQHWYSRRFSALQRLRQRMIDMLGWLARPALIFYNLYRLYDYLYRLEYDLTPIHHQLRAIKPDLLLSTVNVEVTYERAYVLAARELGLPVVNSILSFDNLTSKPAHLLYDYYLAWNRGMQAQLLRFYPQVQPDRVYVTSTPQFDFHRRPECLWKREKTLAHLGLPRGAKYFLYGASPQSLTPEEPQLVALLAEKMQENDMLKDYWLVVRTHPRDEWVRWQKSHRSNRLLLSRALNAAFPSLDDQARLTSSLAYAAACINIASTITFDAAILDRPVIGIRYDCEPSAPREILYEEYDTDHFRPLVESGGLRLAHDWNELLELMCQAVQNPGRDCEARAQMVVQECGIVDGRAAQRVAEALLGCLKKLNE
jgi:hypothetical protein